MRIILLLIKRVGAYTEALDADLSTPIFKDLIWLNIRCTEADKRCSLLQDLQQICTVPNNRPLSLGIDDTVFVLLDGIEESDLLSLNLCIGGEVNLVSSIETQSFEPEGHFPAMNLILRHFYVPVTEATTKVPDKGRAKVDTKNLVAPKQERRDYQISGLPVEFPLLISIAQEIVCEIMHRRLYMAHLRASRVHNISGHSLWLDLMPPTLVTPNCISLNLLYDVSILKGRLLHLYSVRISCFSSREQNSLPIILGAMVDAVVLSSSDSRKATKQSFKPACNAYSAELSERDVSLDGLRTQNSSATVSARNRQAQSVSHYDFADLNTNQHTGNESISSAGGRYSDAATAISSDTFVLLPIRTAMHSEDTCFAPFESNDLFVQRFCLPPRLRSNVARDIPEPVDLGLWEIEHDKASISSKVNEDILYTPLYDIYVGTLNRCASDIAKTYKKRALDAQISSLDIQKLIEDYLPERNHPILDNFTNLSPRTVILRRSDFQELIRLFLQESPQPFSIQEAETLIRKTLVLHMHALLNVPESSELYSSINILDITNTLLEKGVHKHLQHSTIIKLGTKNSEAHNRLSYYTALMVNPIVPLMNQAYFEPLTNSLCLSQSLIQPNAEGVILKNSKNTNSNILANSLLNEIQQYLLKVVQELFQLTNVPYEPISTLAAIVPNYLEWLRALQQFVLDSTNKQNTSVSSPDQNHTLCYCYSENPEEFSSFLTSTEGHEPYQISPHRQKKTTIVSQFIDFVIESTTSLCLTTYRQTISNVPLMNPSSKDQSTPLNEDLRLDPGGQYTSPSKKSISESPLLDSRPQGSRTKQRDPSNSSSYDLKTTASQPETDDNELKNEDSQTSILDGLEPILEATEDNCTSSPSGTEDLPIANMFVADSQWIFFSSENTPCLMAQLGPIAPIKAESYKDFFIQQYNSSLEDAQKLQPSKSKQTSAPSKDKTNVTPPMSNITPENAATVSLELALALFLFELYADEPSAFIINSLLSVLNPDYEELVTEEFYSKKQPLSNELHLSSLKRTAKRSIYTVYYTQEDNKELHCAYLKHTSKNKDVMIIETLRAALRSNTIPPLPSEKGKDSKQKEQIPQTETGPLLSRTQYANMNLIPSGISKTVFLDYARIKAQPTFSIRSTYLLRNYSTFYLTPNDKSAIRSSPLKKRIDFYRMWASLPIQPESDLGSEDFADHFIMLPESSNSITRSTVISQKDIDNGLDPLTTPLPTTSQLKVLFNDKSIALIKGYVLRYVLSDCSLLVDVSFLQKRLTPEEISITMKTDEPDASTKPQSKPSSKQGSRSQSRGGSDIKDKKTGSRSPRSLRIEQQTGQEIVSTVPIRAIIFHISFEENLLCTTRSDLHRFAMIAELCGALHPSEYWIGSYNRQDCIEFIMYSDASCSMQCNNVLLFELYFSNNNENGLQVIVHPELVGPRDSIDTIPNFFSDVVHEVLGFIHECNISKTQPGHVIPKSTFFNNKGAERKTDNTDAYVHSISTDEENNSEVFAKYAKFIPDIANIGLVEITETTIGDKRYTNETHALLIELPLFNLLVIRFLVSQTTMFLLNNGDAILIEDTYMHLFKHNTAFLSLLQVKSSTVTSLLPTPNGPSPIPVYTSPLVLYTSQGFPFWNLFFEQRKKWLVTRKIPGRINFNPKTRPHLGQQNMQRENVVLKDALTLARQMCELAQKEYSEFPAVYSSYSELFDGDSIWRMHHESFVSGTDSIIVPLRGVTRFLLGSPELYSPDTHGQSVSPYPPSLSLFDWTGNTVFCRLGCSFNYELKRFINTTAPLDNSAPPDKVTGKKDIPPTSSSMPKRSAKISQVTGATSSSEPQENVAAETSVEQSPVFKEERIFCYNSTRPFLPPVISPKIQTDVVVELDRVLQEREEKMLRHIMSREQQGSQPEIEESIISKGNKQDEKEKSSRKTVKEKELTADNLEKINPNEESLEVYREIKDILGEVNPIKTYSALQLFFNHFSEIALQKLQRETTVATSQMNIKGKDFKAQPSASTITTEPNRIASTYLSRKDLPQSADDLLDECLQDTNGIPLPCTPIINPRFFVYAICPDLRNALNYKIDDECMGYLKNCEPWVCLHDTDISYLRYFEVLHPLIGTSHYAAISPRSSQTYLKLSTTGRLLNLPNYLFSIPFSSGIWQILMALRSTFTSTKLMTTVPSQDLTHATTSSIFSRNRVGAAKGIITPLAKNTIANNMKMPSKLPENMFDEAETLTITFSNVSFGEYFLALFDPSNPYIPYFNSQYTTNTVEFVELHSFLLKEDYMCFQNLEQTKVNWKISAAQRDLVIRNYQKMETTGITLNKALNSVISILRKERKHREREATRELEYQRELERQKALLIEQRKNSEEEEDKNEVSYDYSVDKPTKSAKLRKHASAKQSTSMALPRIANISPPPPNWRRTFTDEDLDVEYTSLSSNELCRESYIVKYPLLKHILPKDETQSMKRLAHKIITETTITTGITPLTESMPVALRTIPAKINIRQKDFNVLLKNQSEHSLALNVLYDNKILMLKDQEQCTTILPHTSIDLHFKVKVHKATEITITGETQTGETHSVTIVCVEKIKPV